jgi:acyl dehydratase
MFMSDKNARQFGHKRRLVPGPMVLSVAMGLVKETGWFDHVVAVVQFSELRFLKSFHPGQSLKVKIKVIHTQAHLGSGDSVISSHQSRKRVGSQHPGQIPHPDQTLLIAKDIGP